MVEDLLRENSTLLVTAMTTAANPYVPAFEETYADGNSFASLTALLRKKAKLNQQFQRELERERSDREAAEALADDLLQDRISETNVIVSELCAKFEERARTQQVPDDMKDQMRAKVST